MKVNGSAHVGYIKHTTAENRPLVSRSLYGAFEVKQCSLKQKAGCERKTCLFQYLTTGSSPVPVHDFEQQLYSVIVPV